MSQSSRRALRKWGIPKLEYPVTQHLRALLQERLGIDPERRHLEGHEPLPPLPPSQLDEAALQALRQLVGADGLELSDEARARCAAGSTFLDLLQARAGLIGNVPDAVLYPSSEAQLSAILSFCHQETIPVCPVGARSSVTMGVGAPRGGVALDLCRALNRVLEVSPRDHLARVQPGLLGPDYETALASFDLCGGHYPQSFEYSSVGGWIAARGAGQQSTRYGKAEDLLLGLRCVTPTGVVQVAPYERCAMGPDLRQLFAGSEGSLGVLSELSLRVFQRPPCVQPVAFFFKDMEHGVDFVRRWLQEDGIRPAVCRLSDPEETDIALAIDGRAHGFTDKALSKLGYHPGHRVLFIGSCEGDQASARLGALRGTALALRLGGLPLGSHPYRSWEKRRFFDPYLRDALMDRGVLIDTLETTAPWSRLLELWQGVRRSMKARPQTIAMTHISHAYATGANLYFIFISPMQPGAELEDYQSYHSSLLDAIQEYGGALSHHHGVGRLFAPRLAAQLGAGAIRCLKALKAELDPKGIMNPGVLALD
ncbi:MAG: FAD-binding oxidoreductase [Myxococcota bacterium]|jgi:alkyldihydroxyacetonephosphate synthase|nr:FAD-binding oxidoreductase [Myxococcota bacterium]